MNDGSCQARAGASHRRNMANGGGWNASIASFSRSAMGQPNLIGAVAMILQRGQAPRYFARNAFLSILPTEVSGRSSAKVTFSGIAIFEMRPRSTKDATWSRMSSSAIADVVGFKHDQRQRPLAPLDVLDGDDRRALDALFLHDDVLERDRRDPFAAALDDVFQTVGNADVPIRVDRGHVP